MDNSCLLQIDEMSSKTPDEKVYISDFSTVQLIFLRDWYGRKNMYPVLKLGQLSLKFKYIVSLIVYLIRNIIHKYIN